MKINLKSYVDIGKIMRITLSQLLAMLLFIGLVQARDVKTQTILNKTVTLKKADTSLSTFLTQVTPESIMPVKNSLKRTADIIINGKVTSGNGEALPGVIVVVKGTVTKWTRLSNGTLTNQLIVTIRSRFWKTSICYSQILWAKPLKWLA